MQDLLRFQKVQALVDQGATDGERAAARNRATAIAAAAGLTYEEALQTYQGRSFSVPGRNSSYHYDRPRRPSPPAWRGLSTEQRADWLASILNRVTFRMTEPECRAIVAAIEGIERGGKGDLRDLPEGKRAMVRKVYKRAFNWGIRPDGYEAAA